ncbi:Uncharacterised protein [Vibrio cholerae]|nr:Uncharacterised protein [Vibrio cholerae]
MTRTLTIRCKSCDWRWLSEIRPITGFLWSGRRHA